MKTQHSIPPSGVLAALALAMLAGADTLIAQENIVALGRASSAGSLVSGGNSVNGTISVLHNGTGNYTVTVNAPGAFTGASVSDFVPKVAIFSTASGDETIKSFVTAVSADEVAFRVRVDDVEDTANPNAALPRDRAFYFVLMRIPSEFPARAGTRYLLGTGNVNSNGTLESGLGIDGVSVSSERTATGNYTVTLAKTGGFVGDVSTNYVLALTVRGTGTQDQAIRGGVASTASDDETVFRIRTDDVQDNPDASSPTPEDDAFYFTVYRIPGASPGLPASTLLVALARVASDGSLLSPPNSFDGGTLSASRISAGNYRVTILSPGAFAGRNSSEFIGHSILNQNVAADEAIRSNVTILDGDTLQVAVNTNDVEQSGQIQGVADDTPFYLALFDSVATHQPDLRIGRKPGLTKMKGNDRYNATGTGQRLRLALNGTLRSSYFFALENDGNVVDRYRMREIGAGNRLRTNYYRITGGRSNVTSKVKRTGLVEEAVHPERIIRYEGRVKFLSPTDRPSRSYRLLARSLPAPAARDAVRLQIDAD